MDQSLREIENIRRKMIQCGCEYGLNHKKTLEYSVQLDILLNSKMKHEFIKKSLEVKENYHKMFCFVKDQSFSI